MSISLDIRQSQTRSLQDQLNLTTPAQMDSTVASINSELTPPGRLIATSTPNLVVNVGSGTVTNPNTLKNRVLPFIDNSPVSFSGGTITFPSTSGSITVSPGLGATIIIGANQYVAVLVQLDASGNLNVAVGNPTSSLGAVVIPTGTAGLLSLGYVIVQSNGSSVIQPITDAMLYQFVGGGGSGGSQSVDLTGFQPFVDTSAQLIPTTTPGTPASGTFYSSIPNRAPLVDLTQDLKPRFGIQRIATQEIYYIQTENGPAGEQVFGAANDIFGQIRFVGEYWLAQSGTSGSSVDTFNNTTDYLEITFYGTGLNCLSILNNAPRDYRVSVDGGSETNPVNATNSAILDARYSNSNQISNLVKGLTLGVHTVKIRNNDSTFGAGFYGFEILNESVNLVVNPGVGYSEGQKITTSSAFVESPTSIVTGTKGGRILTYQNTDGSIGQSFTACATSPSYLGSTDHVNEEMYRQYYWREFGVGSPTAELDFSIGYGSGMEACFTLDDGVTTLTVHDGLFNTNPDSLGLSAINGYIDFTFIGTGVDIVVANGDGAIATSNMEFYLDGNFLGSSTTIPLDGQTYPIASGLPYGTHVLSIRDTTNTESLYLTGFKIYQPILPSLPSSAVVLGDYNVLANYVANATFITGNSVSQGVIAKANSREWVYFGTGWSITGTSTDHTPSGLTITSTANSDSATYMFFGTGFDFVFSTSNVAGTAILSLDGSNNFSSLTNNFYGPVDAVWSPSTGSLNQNSGTSTSGAKISVQGLTLGIHTFTITSTSTSTIYAESFNIVTPIYSPRSVYNFSLQNQLPIGSNAISDDRKFTPVLPQIAPTKSYGQAILIQTGATTTSTVPVPVQQMNIPLPCKGGLIEVIYAVGINNTADAGILTQIYLDGVAIGISLTTGIAAAGSTGVNAGSAIASVSPGIHQITLFWWCTGGTNVISSGHMTAKEL